MRVDKMNAALLYGNEDLRVEEVDVPHPGPGEVLARVGAATTCGTDVKIYRRGYVGEIVRYPMVFGHEWAGTVEEVGEGVGFYEEGMRVRAGNTAPCLRCHLCRMGKYNLCEDRTWLWGAYAEYIRVPSTIVKHNMQELPPNLTFAEAALTEPLACVLHGAQKAGIKPGDTVVVVGSGPIGILHMQVAKMLGASKVVVVDVVDERLRTAERLGADLTINPSHEEPKERIGSVTSGLGADVVVEAVGLRRTWEQALGFVGKGGTVLEFGGCPPSTKVEVDADVIHYGEVTLLGTFHATPHEFDVALKLIASGAVKAKPLITREMGLQEIEEAFRILQTSKEDLKIAIIP